MKEGTRLDKMISQIFQDLFYFSDSTWSFIALSTIPSISSSFWYRAEGFFINWPTSPNSRFVGATSTMSTLRSSFVFVKFWELSHLTCDLSQAEKKINVVTSWANSQNYIYFTQNDRSHHFEWKKLSFC